MIIVPDVHGRSFWKKVINSDPNEMIIFMGDYHDPYEQDESVNYDDSIANFKEIIEFKKQNMDRVILLIGNHDWHYIHRTHGCWRYDKNIERRTEIRKLFSDNIKLFQMMYETEINGKKYLFSHAGVHSSWVMNNFGDFIDEIEENGLINFLNELSQTDLECFKDAMEQVSYLRGGRDDIGSPIWSDLDEWEDDEELLGYAYQIFSHTRQSSKMPIITRNFSMVDCLRPLYLDENTGVISFYGMKRIVRENRVKRINSKQLCKIIRESINEIINGR